MNINQVMMELDKLFSEERIGEVPQFLETHIDEALAENDKNAQLTLYNECIGFYRETGSYDKSIENCHKAIALMEEMGLQGTMPYATTLLNIANAHRAAGRLEESLGFYNQVRPIYMEKLKADDMYFAGLYNNMSLLYQEMGDFAAAKEQLENALAIVTGKEGAQFEVAVTQANLANTCIELGQDNEAKERAEEAIRIFEEIGVDDAHYSAALSALGSLYYMDKDYLNALDAMEKSRSCVAKYLGAENIQYQRLSDNIEIIREKMSAEAANMPAEVTEAPTAYVEDESQKEEKDTPADSDEIDRILGIDIDNDGWASVIKAGKDKDDSGKEETVRTQTATATEEENDMKKKEPNSPADGVSKFNINQAFADIKAAAKEKLQKQHISKEPYQEETLFNGNDAGAQNKFIEDAPKGAYDEDKAVDAMITEVMEEIAFEVEEDVAGEASAPNEEVLGSEDAITEVEAVHDDVTSEEEPNMSETNISMEENGFDKAEYTDAVEEDKTAEDTVADEIKEVQDDSGERKEESMLSEVEGETEELDETYEDLTPGIMGLELCRIYYEKYGKPMISEMFPEYESQIAVGLVGKGSDCFGFDDIQSRDHDFGPRFIMWVTKEVYDKIGSALQEAYEKLPDEFMSIKRIETFHGKDRAGVMVIEEFYKNTLGFDLIGALKGGENGMPQIKSWLAVNDYALAAAVNGVVFRDDEGIFTSYRELLMQYYPKAVWYRKIAQACALFSQNGQYNLPRMRKRGQLVAAELAKAECVKQAMKLYYLLNRKYAPHDKWLFKALPDNPDMVIDEEGMQSCKSVPQLVEEISLMSARKKQETELTIAIESLAVIFANELERQNIVGDAQLYLDANTAELTAKSDALLTAVVANTPVITALSLAIAKAEFEAFDKVQNEGGRASCQNNWPTFKVMRMSQYMTWDEDMLLQYLYEFKTNYANGRNMIEEKYARMMASTAPEEYEQFADRLPEIAEEKRQIMEEIIALQVKWMEEFAAEYPKLAGNARTIHTAEDLPDDTSYETYLRGELGTYSDKMLEMYGRYIVEYAKSGKSVTRDIMTNTIKFYGYESFEEAESKEALGQ